MLHWHGLLPAKADILGSCCLMFTPLAILVNASRICAALILAIQWTSGLNSGTDSNRRGTKQLDVKTERVCFHVLRM